MRFDSDYFDKFPSILREALKSGEVLFPEGLEIEYKPIRAYRAIARDVEDTSPVGRRDFRSYAERGMKRVRGNKVNRNDPHYYGVSLFLTRAAVENAMHFPNPHKKICEGMVCQEAGPQETSTYRQHVCWWLYEGCDIKGFRVL